MDLKSGYPYWAIKNGLMYAFAPVTQDVHCEVAVIGGGISGALIANELGDHGFDVAVIEQRDIGWGSSAASTALLQYEIDTPMTELCKRYGEDNAALAYTACARAIDMLAELAADVRDVGFCRAQSLYYASRRFHVDGMRNEFALRQKHGFDVQWLSSADLESDYGILSPGGILSQLAGRVDPYRMASRLLARCRKRGAQVFDRSRIHGIKINSRTVTLRTDRDFSVHAKHVILAAGYANQTWLRQKIARNRSSYAFITDPLDRETLGCLQDTLVWESARPYLYLRSTRDARLLGGGEDDAID
ncbi:MAG: NAD(P)/FAD-dependent oxidoreductase, partial [Rhodanobacteraceae bacterium]